MAGRREVDDAVSILSLSVLEEQASHINVTWEDTLSGRESWLTYSYLVSGGRFHNCGDGVSLCLSAKRGFVNLDVVWVPSTPQSEVLNPRFSEYPPRWPVFSHGWSCLYGAYKGAHMQAPHSQTTLHSVWAQHCWPGNTGLILLRLARNHNVKPVCERQWLWKSVCMILRVVEMIHAC